MLWETKKKDQVSLPVRACTQDMQYQFSPLSLSLPVSFELE